MSTILLVVCGVLCAAFPVARFFGIPLPSLGCVHRHLVAGVKCLKRISYSVGNSALTKVQWLYRNYLPIHGVARYFNGLLPTEYQAPPLTLTCWQALVEYLASCVMARHLLAMPPNAVAAALFVGASVVVYMMDSTNPFRFMLGVRQPKQDREGPD